jgi:hypothetical protein
MQWKTTIALFLVTVGIGAYIALYEIKQPLPGERERLSRQVADIPPESVRQLTIDFPVTKITLDRSAHGWQVSPPGARADADRIERLLLYFSPLSAERFLTGSAQQPLDLKTYGLDPAVGTLTVTSADQATTLLFGSPTPIQQNRYAMARGRPEVAIVPDDVFVESNQTPEKFRDPKLVRFNPWTVQEVRLTSAAGSVSLSRAGQAWALTQPVSDAADSEAVQALLNSLSRLAIARFVNEVPQVEQLAEWGLDQPSAEVTMRLDAGPVTLFFGKPLPQDASLIHAKRDDEPAMYAVASGDVDALRKAPNSLRSTACFAVSVPKITKVEISREGGTLVLTRSGQDWKVEGSDALLETKRVEEFLKGWETLRLVDFIDETASDLSRYGLQPPAGTLAAWIEGSTEPARVRVGSAIEGGTTRYGRIEGRQAVVSLPEQVTDWLAATPERFTTPTASESTASPAASAAAP